MMTDICLLHPFLLKAIVVLNLAPGISKLIAGPCISLWQTGYQLICVECYLCYHQVATISYA
jgi:hypothetical protein